MRQDDGRMLGAVKVRREGQVISGKMPLGRALREQGLQAQAGQEKETGRRETRYEWVEDYDPVLGSHCRIR